METGNKPGTRTNISTKQEAKAPWRSTLILQRARLSGGPEKLSFLLTGASQVAPVVKNPSANVGVTGDMRSIPGLGIFPGGGNGNPLQYSCLGNPMDGGAWGAVVHRVAKS